VKTLFDPCPVAVYTSIMDDNTPKGERKTLAELSDVARGGGIVCPRCGCVFWKVRDTDKIDGAVRRYRVCRSCGAVKTTFER